MKNYQKNSRNPSVPFSCMFEQCLSYVLDKTNKWHLNNHIWSLNLNLGFKPTSFNLVLGALAQNTFILPCHSMYHIVHCIDRVFLYLPVIVPSRQTCTGNVIDDTDEELYYLQKCQASKTPLFILIKSHSLAPLSSTALGQQ